MDSLHGSSPKGILSGWALALSVLLLNPTTALATLPYMTNPCLDPKGPHASLPFCDATLPIDERVKDAVSRLTLHEKFDNLGTAQFNETKSLGLYKYNWWSECTHGAASIRNMTTTNFAFPITTAMSFNRTLWRDTGAQIGREARAAMNAGNAYSTFWAPVINLAREPRWGRNLETPGEDPYLTGEYAIAYVQGLQESPDDPAHIQASACCKHYVANEMESTTNWGIQWDRYHVDSYVSQQDLFDSYMPPFQACVEKGRVSGLMCSYNAVNGVPSCANDWLLDTIARKEWGFDGYITSDCDADSDVFASHKYTKTPEEAVRAVLHAGTDVDCGEFVQRHVASAYEKGVITEKDIDARLEKLFKLRMRLGHFDPEGPLQRIPASEICSDRSKAVAREGSIQGSTLVKNVEQALPLKKGVKVAVIGPNAGHSAQNDKITGYYAGWPCGSKLWNMVDAVNQYAMAYYSMGVPGVMDENTTLIADAVHMVKDEDVDEVVVVVGTDLSWAMEGKDASNIHLTNAQMQLIIEVAAAAKKPIIVVTMTHIPLDISKLLETPEVGAILHVGQPSVQTLGIGDLLFGERVPSGRLVQTIYPASYQNEVSIFDFGMRPGPSNFPRPDCTLRPYSLCSNATNPGRTHRFYTGKPVLPFGYGLSYTTFKYDVSTYPMGPVSLDPIKAMLLANKGRTFLERGYLLESGNAFVQYAVKVTNTGTIDADHVLLGILQPPGAGHDGIPLQTLFAFERMHIPAGETRKFWLFPELSEFTQVNTAGERYVLPGNYTFQFGIAENLDDYTTPSNGDYAEHSVFMV